MWALVRVNSILKNKKHTTLYSQITRERRIALLLLSMLFSFGAVAQTNRSDTLKEVKVKGRKKEFISDDARLNTFSPGQKVKAIDSITLQQYKFQSMANLLSQQVPVFVKSYGFNGLATLNFRGASAAQSQVYWNGVPLQNAALGISDVSLLPVSLMNNVNVVYGGSSALWGSGNVGGALVVETGQPYFDSNGSWKPSISAVAGSYGQYQFGAKSVLSSRRWYVNATVYGQAAKNNFKFEDKGNSIPTENAEMRSGVVQLQTAYHLNDKNTIGLTGWYQQYYREIPRALFESISFKNQRDESLRLLANWDRKGTRASYYSKIAYLRDYMHYRDSTILLNTQNLTNQVFAEVGLKYKFNYHHQFMIFTPVHISWMERELKHDVKTQRKMALAVAYAISYFDNRLNASASLRGEIINTTSVLLPGINASFAITNWLSLRANVQRSYRAPTLNELYYDPGGNEKLKAEYGWSKDAGYAVKTQITDHISFSHDLSYFNRTMHNWILWFGGAIWTPHNIAIVYSRGLESENKLMYRSANWNINLGLNTSYVLATTVESDIPNDGSIGKQIPYSPRYSGQANFGIGYKKLYINYNHTYTGYRFITTDESQYLLPYNTANIQLLYSINLSSNTLQLTAQCNNIFNKSYAVVNGRLMPGINWLAGLSFNFN